MAEEGDKDVLIDTDSVNEEIGHYFDKLRTFDPGQAVSLTDPKTNTEFVIRSTLYEHDLAGPTYLFGLYEKGELEQPVGIFQVGTSPESRSRIAYAGGKNSFKELITDKYLLDEYERKMIEKYFSNFEVQNPNTVSALEIVEKYKGRHLGQLLLAVAQLTLNNNYKKIRLGQDKTIREGNSFYTHYAKGESANGSTWIETKLTPKQKELVISFMNK